MWPAPDAPAFFYRSVPLVFTYPRPPPTPASILVSFRAKLPTLTLFRCQHTFTYVRTGIEVSGTSEKKYARLHLLFSDWFGLLSDIYCAKIGMVMEQQQRRHEVGGQEIVDGQEVQHVRKRRAVNACASCRASKVRFVVLFFLFFS